MREVSFHRDLYRGASVDEAVKVFAPYAEFELEERQDYWVVRITGKNAARERRVAGELANYALGSTIENRGGQ